MFSWAVMPSSCSLFIFTSIMPPKYIVHSFNDNTIRFILHYHSQIQPEALQQAAFALVGSRDVLHASFTARRNDVQHQINSIWSEDCFTHITTDENPIKCALKAVTESISCISSAKPTTSFCKPAAVPDCRSGTAAAPWSRYTAN